jgi:hypothetical protein
MERSTSAVKSTWPGVSMMLTRCRTPENGFSSPSSSFGVQVQEMAAAAMVMPFALFDRIEVHRGVAVMHVARMMDRTRVKKDALGQGRLARIDVRSNADVPRPFNRKGAARGGVCFGGVHG